MLIIRQIFHSSTPEVYGSTKKIDEGFSNPSTHTLHQASIDMYLKIILTITNFQLFLQEFLTFMVQDKDFIK